ncbi:helix-turn-helix transcriptional regulator [Pararhodobacter zhoushanensis]|uniref:LuxR family transcriptional regulator n=1 Tax=Pararhodobacter zhoushanensis TaxID=2479545 RepID=A0ABT3H0A8_9RHOB|nr:LuxR family transcriptional regulator [Pararhodobacter zhoushanensis]MCW1933254.1 LuxR family transcriptional regulator [Pararhodobacter zhoushanensis]
MEHQAISQTSGRAPLSDSGTKPRALPGIATFLTAILTATDREILWSLLCRFFADLGFDHVIYGYSPDLRGPVMSAPDEYVVLSTLADDVITTLIEKQYYRMNASFGWALENAGIASWSMTEQESGIALERQVTDEALGFFERNNLSVGCTIGFPQERTRGRAVMGLAARRGISQVKVDAQLEVNRDVIFTAASVAHLCLVSLPYHIPGRRLTVRQREVLEWVGNGKTTADIAQIMGITPPTVEKHLRLARETLGVETTAHALIKAAFLNQVFLPVRLPAERNGIVTPLRR